MFSFRVIVLFTTIIYSNATFDEIGTELFRAFEQDNSQIDPSIDRDARLTVPQLITKYGYNSEIHHVTTEDGYILELHRITGGPKSPPRKGKKVCFLMHGFIVSSAAFVLAGPSALAFRLADEDFDIWMGNCRGNVYSTSHTTYNAFGSQKDQVKFWSYSLHELGYYDVPASIDYVLNATGEAKLQYLAHSQGTTTFFIMASERPEYMDKIEILHAMAPAVYIRTVKVPLLKLVAPFANTLYEILKCLGFQYVYVTPIRDICRDIKELQTLCEQLLINSSGETDQTNTTLLTVIFGHFPSGNPTVRQAIHFLQNMYSRRFRKFDYGPSENLLRYKQNTPPNYDLQKTTIPVAVYYAKGDWLTAFEDVRLLIKELPNVSKDYSVPHKKFNHNDFLWGIDAGRLVYDEIVKNMKSTGRDVKKSKT